MVTQVVGSGTPITNDVPTGMSNSASSPSVRVKVKPSIVPRPNEELGTEVNDMSLRLNAMKI
jgi:hypothetical protein